MNMRFIAPEGQVAVLSESVVEHLMAHRQKQWGKEAGGQLFGVFEDSRTVRILKATGPRKTDLRRRLFYKPDKLAEQREIDEAFGSGLHYVGDWHTHPETIPSPSGFDVDSLQNVFRMSTHSLNYLLLAVVGRADPPDGLYMGLVSAYSVYPMSPAEDG